MGSIQVGEIQMRKEASNFFKQKDFSSVCILFSQNARLPRVNLFQFVQSQKAIYKSGSLAMFAAST